MTEQRYKVPRRISTHKMSHHITITEEQCRSTALSVHTKSSARFISRQHIQMGNLFLSLFVLSAFIIRILLAYTTVLATPFIAANNQLVDCCR